MSDIFQNVVIGSGPSAFAAAYALRRLKKDFIILDAGFELESDIAQQVDQLKSCAPQTWPEKIKDKLFPLPQASAGGVEKRYLFGSDFVYRPTSFSKVIAKDSIIDISYARGGFGNVWGAALLPYTDDDISRWGIDVKKMRAAYARVLDYLPMTGAHDGLQHYFPVETHQWGDIPSSTACHQLSRYLTQHTSNDQMIFGKARLAVEASQKNNQCQLCGFCLDGCAYGAIFNPRIRWKQLGIEDIDYRAGCVVEKISGQSNSGDPWVIHARDIKTGELKELKAVRIFLGAGAINSTAIIARSFGLEGKRIPMLDSQYFFCPAFLFKSSGSFQQDRFTLAELFVELRNSKQWSGWMHFQVYSFNRIFQAALKKMLGFLLDVSWIKSFFAGRFLLFQGFLHSDDSATLEMIVQGECVSFSSKEKRDTRKKALRAIFSLQKILKWRVFFLFPLLKLVKPGRSFHVGGSFPMGKTSSFYSDQLAQPMGVKNIHLIDAAAFPSIPANTYAYSLMAHADRVVTDVFSENRHDA